MKFRDGEYKVLVNKGFSKIVKKKLRGKLGKVLDRKIGYLKDNPHRPSLNTKLLSVSDQWLKQRGIDAAYEFKVTDSFRCVFYVFDAEKEIVLIMVGNHGDVRRHAK